MKNFLLKYKKQEINLKFQKQGNVLSFKVEDQEPKQVELLQWKKPYFKIKFCDVVMGGYVFRDLSKVYLSLPQGYFNLELLPSTAKRQAKVEGHLQAPMPGKILKLLVEKGQRVREGEVLMVLEAMKMEHPIISPIEGVVSNLFFLEGDRVSQSQELIEVTPLEEKSL